MKHRPEQQLTSPTSVPSLSQHQVSAEKIWQYETSDVLQISTRDIDKYLKLWGLLNVLTSFTPFPSLCCNFPNRLLLFLRCFDYQKIIVALRVRLILTLFLLTSVSLTFRCCNTDSAIWSLLLQVEPQGRRPTPNWFFGTSLGSESAALCAAWTSWHNHSFFRVRHLQRTTTWSINIKSQGDK